MTLWIMWSILVSGCSRSRRRPWSVAAAYSMPPRRLSGLVRCPWRRSPVSCVAAPGISRPFLRRRSSRSAAAHARADRAAMGRRWRWRTFLPSSAAVMSARGLLLHHLGSARAAGISRHRRRRHRSWAVRVRLAASLDAPDRLSVASSRDLRARNAPVGARPRLRRAARWSRSDAGPQVVGFAHPRNVVLPSGLYGPRSKRLAPCSYGMKLSTSAPVTPRMLLGGLVLLADRHCL